ncbi:myosin heavy chain, non-muscle isoform X4 [Gallus gallus]|uniref:myosin heavy chain, non-muscle isoform X4 n=1 Tax=Gallus gallus TaxID=9031 RepID=UPI001AE6C2DE|nr:myosin heavy chain, non-muscle isoform X4 [Gallus gallus]
MGHAGRRGAGLSATVRGGVRKERLLVVKSPLAPCSENCAPECDSPLQNQEEIQARGRSRKDAEKGTRKEIEELQAQGRSRVDAEIGTLKKEIEELQAQGRSMEDAEKGTLKKEIEELQAQGRSMEDAEKGTLKKEIVCAEEPRAKNGILEKENEELRAKYEELQARGRSRVDAEIGTLKKEIEELRAKYEELQARGRSRADAEIGTLKKEIEELRAKYEELQAQGRSRADAEIGTLKKEIEELCAKSEELQAQGRSMEDAEKGTLKKEIEELQAQGRSMEDAEKGTLKKEIVCAEEPRAKNGAPSKESGACPQSFATEGLPYLSPSLCGLWHEELCAKNGILEKENEELRAKYEELQARGRSRVDAEIGTLKKEIEELRAKYEELQAQGRSMEDAEKGTLKKEIEELQAQGRSMEDAEKGTLKKEIVCAEEPRAKNGILEKENEELRAKYEELQARGRSRVDAEIGTLKKEIEELRAKYEELQARGRSRADAEIGTLKKEIEELRAKYEELQAQGRSRADAEIGTLKKEIEELCAKSEELQAQGRSMEDAEKGTLKKEIVCAEEPRAKNGAPSKESGACPQSFATEGLPYLSPSLCGLWHEELCAKNGILEKENEELRAKYEELQARGRSRVDAEIGTLKKEIEELRAKYEELQAQGRSMEDAEKGTLKKEIVCAEEPRAKNGAPSKESGACPQSFATEGLPYLSPSLCGLWHEELCAKNGILEKENEELRAKYEELQARGRSRVDAEIGTLKKEIEELRAKYAPCEKQIAQCQKQLEEIQAQGRAGEDAEKEELRAKYEELQARGRSGVDAEIGTLKKEIDVSILIAADAEVLAEPSGTHVSQERSGWPHHETGSRSQAPAATSSGIPSDVCFLASLETLSLRPRMGLTAVIFLLVLASRHQPTAGVGHDPLLVVDDYEDGGIRLKCLSERLFSEAQLLWTDSRGDNITGTPLSADTGTAGVSSSIVLKAGSGNSMSCRILDKQLKTSTESSVAIADAFFPSTSPWLAAFVVILLLSIFLVLAAIYKIRNNNKEITRAQNARKQIEQDIDELKRKLDEQERRFEKENEDAEKRIENVRNELKFRKARSNAVNITLDQKCKHPNLCISDDKRRVKSSDKKETALKAMVVATEGFPDKKHYWEVEVGNQSQWELGVVSENVRNMIMNNMGISPPVNGLFSLQYSQGKYILTGREDVSDCKQCSVVGVLLDVESSELSFYSVEEMSPLGSVVLEFTGKLYPFFSPDSSGKWLGVRPVKPQTYDPLPQGEKEINK